MILTSISESPSISLDEVWCEGSRLLFKISFDEELRRYFDTGILYIKYDVSLDDVKPSILTIPLITSIIAVSWATGATIRVNVIDQGFLDSIKQIQKVLRENKWHPDFSFSGDIVARKRELNKFGEPDRLALLYSGGIDSITSYLKNEDKHPRLVMVRGSPDDPLYQQEPWNKTKSKSMAFAEEVGSPISFIETNMYDLIHNPGPWWTNVYMSLALLGVCAPLTAVTHIGTILIASTFTKEFSPKRGTHPLIDGKVKWGDLKVVHDAYDLTRHQKIREYIAPYLKHSTLPLKVCFSGRVLDKEEVKANFSNGVLNCGRCEKCQRTIVGLLLEGSDPKHCGFDMNSFSFAGLKKDILTKELKFDEHAFYWTDIQRNISSSLVLDSENQQAVDFFKWLREYDLSKNIPHESNLHRAYKALSYRARRRLILPQREK